MGAISTAGAGLLTWLLAIVNYCSVAKKVVPKRKAVETAQKQQKQNQKDLENIKAEVQVLIFTQTLVYFYAVKKPNFTKLTDAYGGIREIKRAIQPGYFTTKRATRTRYKNE